jgi:mRNA interferase RelE/StbE
VYHIEFEAGSRKEFLKLPRQIQDDLIPLIDSLVKNPRPFGSKKLKGAAGYRIRKGDYRILYTVNNEEQVIRIYRVGHRREVYR